ncbi:MAG: hypothetical protein V5A68_05665, partial [Candidatus Thermoplasmatota archaeon]
PDPVVTKNHVYVPTVFGSVKSYGLDGDLKWTHNLNQISLIDYMVDYILDPQNNSMSVLWEELSQYEKILAPPIVSDGILYLSCTRDIANLSGNMHSIGDYNGENIEGTLISKPISVPGDKWWNSFYVNDSGDIDYSILDENYNILKEEVTDSENISNVDSRTIRLKAELQNTEEDPDCSIDNWTLTWKSNNPPVIRENTFQILKNDEYVLADETWLTTHTPKCKIKGYDMKPGLNVSSAEYRIRYLSKSTEDKEMSDWFSADCSGQDGSKSNETITFDISGSSIANKVKKLIFIDIAISDTSGNRNSDRISDFRIDAVDPEAEILDTSEYKNVYSSPVFFNASGEDEKSGLKSIGLYYKLRKGEEWTEYSTYYQTPYSWTWSSSTSGVYDFCAIAKDNASNMEGKQREISFTYDENKPYIQEGYRNKYQVNIPPMINVTFKDDYELQKIEYRLNTKARSNWTLLKDEINSGTYEASIQIDNQTWNNFDESESYYVYFNITDSVGNNYLMEDNIIEIVKDLTVNRVSLDFPDFDSFRLDDKYDVQANVDDEDIKEIHLYYRYSENEENWSEWKRYGQPQTENFKWVFEPKEGDGFYEFKTKAWDSAGNVAGSDVERKKIESFPLLLVVAAIIISAVVLVAVFIFVVRRKDLFSK